MIIAIDMGNSRLKWALNENGAWLDKGGMPLAHIEKLADVVDNWPISTKNAHIVISNVAGEERGEKAFEILARRFSRISWVVASRICCGVRNAYDFPTKLGSDRWAALIAARARTAPHACLVVCAGTATTIDWLDSSGVFRGGLILPGTNLIRRALARDTAQLPLAEGCYSDEPHTTEDAIISGALHAQAGAIERMYAKIAADERASGLPVSCFLSGGAAYRIAPCLGIPFEVIDNLILEGIVCFGASAACSF